MNIVAQAHLRQLHDALDVRLAEIFLPAYRTTRSSRLSFALAEALAAGELPGPFATSASVALAAVMTPLSCPA